MKWRNWKLGLLTAAVIGFFTACGAAAVLDVKLDYKFYLFFIGLIGKDIILYLKDHPAEQVTFDTTFKSLDKNNAGPFDRPPEPPKPTT